MVTGDSSSDAGRCADELWHLLCTCAVVFLLEDKSRLWEGSIKGEHTRTLGLSSGFLGLNGLVYQQVTDPLLQLYQCLLWSRV